MKTIDELKNDKGEIDSNAIKQIIPYDQPFLMVDRILTLDKTKVVAIKNTSANEPFFKGLGTSGLLPRDTTRCCGQHRPDYQAVRIGPNVWGPARYESAPIFRV